MGSKYGHSARQSCASPILDSFDRAILREVQKDNRIALRNIGQRVHLSAAAVQRRLRRMECEGVIRANTAVLEPSACGAAITVFVEVELEREHTVAMEQLKARLRTAPQVQQCYYVTGRTDFLLIVVVPDMAAYERFIEKHFSKIRTSSGSNPSSSWTGSKWASQSRSRTRKSARLMCLEGQPNGA